MKNQKGISPVSIVITLIIVTLIAGLLWYFMSNGESVQDKNTNIAPVSNSNTNISININSGVVEDWQTYTNDTYGYELQYPADWYYVPDAMSGPPPPATAFFANTEQISGTDYASFFVYVGIPDTSTLDEISEVVLLVEDGYTKTDTTVDGNDAVQLKRRTHPSDTGGSLYIIKNGFMYRIVWGGTSVAVFETHEVILEEILNSFIFLGPPAADFLQEGNISIPVIGEENVGWHLLYEDIGSPALTRELIFDHNYIISQCTIEAEEMNCSQAIDQGLVEVGDRVTIEGVELGNDKVAVLELRK